MPYAIDPATGLPVDELGNIVDPAAAGSDVVSEFNPPHIEMGEPPHIEMDPMPARVIEMEPDIVANWEQPNHIEFEADTVPPEHGGAVVMPGQVAVDAGTQPVQTSRSQSFRGMTDKGLKKSGDLFDRELGKVDPEVDRLRGQADADKAAMRGAYGRHRDAIFDIGEQTRQYYEREAVIQDQLRDVHETAADLEQHAYTESKAERAQYISAYKQQLAAVKTLATQSGNPYAQMGGGEALGLAAAHFAQGFLAARGVQIDVAGQVDRWVDRSIREHQQKIQNMREGAQDQLHLYEIARQTSADDWEARQRVRGFMIEGLKQKIVTEASRFNSSVAMAKAQEQVAKLDIEAQTTEMAIGQRFEQQRFQQRQQAIDIAKHKGSLAVQWAAQKESERHHKELEGAAKKKAAGDDKAWSSKIVDPFDVKKDPKTGRVLSGGKYKWEVDTRAPDGIQSKAATTATEISAYYAKMRRGVDEMRRLRPAAVAAMKGPDAYRAFSSQAYREYKAAQGRVMELAQQHITGAAAPTEQAKRIHSWTADDNLLESGTNEKLIEGFNEGLRQEYESTMNSIVGVKKLKAADFAEGESEYEDVAPVADPDRKLLYEAGNRDALKSETAEAEAMVVGETHNKGTHAPSPMYFGYIKPKMEGASNYDREVKLGGYTMSNEMKAIDQLAIALVRPETLVAGTVEGQPAEDPEQIRAEATQLLSDIAAGKPLSTGKAADKEVQEYARHVIEQGKHLSWDEDVFYTRVASQVTPDDGEDERPLAQRTMEDWNKKLSGTKE